MSNPSDQSIVQKPEEGPPPILTEFQLQQNSDTFNEGTKVKQLIHEQYNTARNLQPIMDKIADGTARDIGKEPKVDGVPYFVIGSGGGLDDSIEHLREWKGGIICSTSHALTLMYFGIEPTHIIALDPFSMWSEIDGVDWSKTRTKLILHPGVWPDLVQRWPNDILLYRQDMGQADSFYATAQNYMFANRTGGREESTFDLAIPTTLTLFSCSPPGQLFAGAVMGYGTVFLAGMDFGFGSGKHRFTMYTPKKQAEPNLVDVGNGPPIDLGTPAEWDKEEALWTEPEDQTKVARDQDRTCISEDGVYTNQISIFYKRNFISAWRMSLKPMYTTDINGSLQEVPFMDIGKVIATQGNVKEWKPEQIKKVAERYLARANCWVIEDATGGCNFIESKQPEFELTNWIYKMRQQCICPTCNLGAVNETADPPESRQCPRCQRDHFVRRHDIDVRKNISRIWALMDYAKKMKEQ